jgi:DNA-binding XRE family transcriptional regulator
MKSEKLKQIRKQCGYTQSQMATIFSYSRQNYSLKERNLSFKKSEIKILKEMFQLTKEECFDLFLGE